MNAKRRNATVLLSALILWGATHVAPAAGEDIKRKAAEHRTQVEQSIAESKKRMEESRKRMAERRAARDRGNPPPAPQRSAAEHRARVEQALAESKKRMEESRKRMEAERAAHKASPASTIAPAVAKPESIPDTPAEMRAAHERMKAEHEAARRQSAERLAQREREQAAKNQKKGSINWGGWWSGLVKGGLIGALLGGGVGLCSALARRLKQRPEVP